MTYYSGSEWDDEGEWDDGTHDDAHEDVNVPEPFRTLLRLTSTRRYDLRANLANRLGLPRRRSISVGTERFLDALFESVCLAWQTGNAPATRDRARGFVKDAFYYLPFDDVISVIEDFGWGESMSVTTTPRTYEADIQRVAVGRLARRVEQLLTKAHRAQQRHAA